MLFIRNKYKKYKKIVFIDTENIGFELPVHFNDDMYCIFFINGKTVPSQLIEYNCYENIEIMNLYPLQKQINANNKANFLDFCLVTHIGEILRFIKDKEIIISTKDNGFLGSVAFLKSRYPHLNIRKEELNQSLNSKKDVVDVHNPCVKDNLPKWLKDNINRSPLSEDIYNKINKYYDNDELQQNLNKTERAKFLLQKRTVPISNIHGYIGYDVYKKIYKVCFLGHYTNELKDKTAAKQDFELIYDRLNNLSGLFQSHKQYAKIRELKIIPYVIEAHSKKISLFENLCCHMDYDKAYNLMAQI